MPTAWVVAVVLAVAAAGCFAVAAALQNGAVVAVSATAGSDRLGRGELGLLVRRPRWLVGTGLAALGSAVHAFALVLAPLSLVQPLGVLAVPVAVLLAAGAARRRPRRAAIVGVALSTAGVAAFVALASVSVVSGPATGQALAWAGSAVAVLVVVLVGAALAGTGRWRCLAFASAGAAAFGLVSVLVRAVGQAVVSGTSPLDPMVLLGVAGIGGALVAGGWAIQHAHAAGPAELVVACMTVVDPFVAVLVGATLLGEATQVSGLVGTLLVAAAATAFAGVLVLARSHPVAECPSPAAPAGTGRR